MSNPWFRMYAEFANDPKVQMLSEVNQRRFVMLLCFRCSNDDETFQDEHVTFQLRISNDEWNKTREILLANNLINEHNIPRGWNKRQFLSDSSTERVKKHREKKKREGNVTETKCNALEQNRTDTEQNRIDSEITTTTSDDGELISSDFFPTNQTAQFLFDQGVPQKFIDDYVDEFILYWADIKGRKRSWDAVFCRQCLEQARERNYAPKLQAVGA